MWGKIFHQNCHFGLLWSVEYICYSCIIIIILLIILIIILIINFCWAARWTFHGSNDHMLRLGHVACVCVQCIQWNLNICLHVCLSVMCVCVSMWMGMYLAHTCETVCVHPCVRVKEKRAREKEGRSEHHMCWPSTSSLDALPGDFPCPAQRVTSAKESICMIMIRNSRFAFFFSVTRIHSPRRAVNTCYHELQCAPDTFSCGQKKKLNF